MMKIDQKWYLIAIAVVLASILLPFMQAGSFAGNVVESTVVYRDGWFGPYIERVTLDNGGVTYVTQYPWYYFTDGYLPSMNIYGIEGSGYSNEIHLTSYPDDEPIIITVKQQNDLKFPNSIFPWMYDEVDAVKSRLVMYKGIATEGEKLSSLTDPWDDLVWTHGPFVYSEKWTTDVQFDPWYYDGGDNPKFTIEETLYPSSLVGYDMDRAFVYVTVLKRVNINDPNDPVVVGGTGTITVTILDNLIQSPATIRMYKDGVLVQSSLYIKSGEHKFTDLEFGTYKFEVVDADYEIWFYDASPQQSGFDYDSGNVELSAELNTIGYIIKGDFPSTEGDGFDMGDGLLPVVPDNNMSELYDDAKKLVDEDGSLSLTQIIGLIAAVLSSIGLLTSVAVIGLPIFIVVILFLLGAAFVKSGDKKPNQKYSPGNKKGGRKR